MPRKWPGTGMCGPGLEDADVTRHPYPLPDLACLPPDKRGPKPAGTPRWVPSLPLLRKNARELPRCPWCDVAAGWPCVDTETGIERVPHDGRRHG